MTAHLDTFARDNLPPRAQWPDFLFELPELNYPSRMNCVVELLDRWVAAGHGDRPCLVATAIIPGEKEEHLRREPRFKIRRAGKR